MGGALKHDLTPTGNDGLMTYSSEEQARHLFERQKKSNRLNQTEQRTTELVISELFAKYKAELTDSEDLKDRNDITLHRELTGGHFIDWYLSNPLPGGFVGYDASRSWLLYWNTHPHHLLQCEPFDGFRISEMKETLLRFRPIGSKQKGGFGGGSGQIMHLAPTYAAVMALAYVCGTIQDWEEVIDQRAMHDWLMQLKQPDGSFTMHVGGEVDTRAGYCALSVAALLNILTPELAENAAEYITNCQTYEGGLACASYPYHTTSSSNPPQAEAHGGYAFCGLASYFLLQPPSSPASSTTQLDFDALYRWAAQMQGVPVEGGGFRGRTNKLVDGCYSWWNGGLFQMLQPYLGTDVDLFDREALQEYILIAAQAIEGGCRDKPGKGPDCYHTCYVLSGLSAAQHQMAYSPTKASASSSQPFQGKDETADQAQKREAEMYASLMGWTASPTEVVGGERNRLAPTHPIFNITMERASIVLKAMYGQQ